MTHSYGWDVVHDFARSKDGLEVRLHPGIGARIYLETEDVDGWSASLREARVAARA